MAPHEGRRQPRERDDGERLVDLMRRVLAQRPENLDGGTVAKERLQQALIGLDRAAAPDLPPHVREWIGGKSKEQLATIDQMARDYEAARTIGRFLKWAAIALAGIFGAFWAFGEKIAAVLTFFRIGRLP